MGTLAAGIKEIFATAKTTGSNVMLCGNDGTPDGHMTMANLASVLGVPKDYGRVDNVSFNIDTLITTAHEFSILEFGSTNNIGGTKPSGITGWATLLTICPNVEGTQYLCDATEKLFVRKSDDGAISQWNEVGINIPSFYKDYNNLSALASALGVANDSFQVKKMVASTVGMGGVNTPLKVEGDNHDGSIAILNNLGNGGFGISFRINGAEVGWLGYEVSDGKLHWNSASSGSHVIA